MTTARRLSLIAALALVPVAPYLLLGYTGQDFSFHVCSWLDLREGWLVGHLHPGWSAAANYGRGDPHLTFYPPISYLLGAFLTLTLPLKIAPGAYVWLALMLSGVTMYAASKPFVADRDRVTAAVLYMLGPYMVTTSLVRFAAAELLVQAWVPLIVLCFYQAFWTSTEADLEPRRRSRRALLFLGLLLGLSWTTNIPASIVLLYSLAIVAGFRAVVQRSVRPMLRMIVAEAIAAALAAFYLLPVWRERPWVNPGILLRVDPRQLLLFMPHSSFDDSPMLVVCWIFLCTQTLIAVACLWKRTRTSASDPELSAWACLAAVSFFLQSPLSIPLWRHAPELGYVQFPFRFLPIIGAALPLLLLSRGTRRTLRQPTYFALALLATTPFLAFLSVQAIPANRTPPLPALLASWQRKGVPEYLPTGTSMPSGPAEIPAISAVSPANPPRPDPACHAEVERQTPDLRIFHTASQTPCRVRLMLYFYPSWRAFDESGHKLPTMRDPTGFLLVDVPAGDHAVSVAFRPASPIRTGSAIVSLAALLLLVAVLLLDRRGASSLNPP